jgi:hypothetical protein
MDLIPGSLNAVPEIADQPRVSSTYRAPYRSAVALFSPQWPDYTSIGDQENSRKYMGSQARNLVGQNHRGAVRHSGTRSIARRCGKSLLPPHGLTQHCTLAD